ncbi:LLM class flavin-dependent oxidoreductase [Pseudonocardia eucalypti]|uniref:LLM class flavin-dependent oxidoreductase n=1 Tax=Pseudonocardia eucalypti TaxID=648755 RepID=A0ABP9QBA1_9PSEU|nr:alkanesulfonate monooxygenase SsuD/methylene tetrahydromethanopterin reductase-like flavin-dependent oxidoreductase (luciferase family) [Pseudonocardia eucalypti]
MTHLAVQLDPAVVREPHRAESWVSLVGAAERAGFDFVAIPDSFRRGQLDAVAIAARVAPATSAIGLVPTATVTHTEPFHLSKAIGTLDFVSLGRAGWAPDVTRTEAEAALFGRKSAAPADALWRELAEAVEVVVRLWDSWEDDAVIRDAATGRYVDREKLHYIDFAGEFFSVKGPSITPRSPQAHPLVVLRADEPSALPVVGRWADVARVTAPDLAEAAAARRRVRDAVTAAGRSPESVAVLLDVPTPLALRGDRQHSGAHTAGLADFIERAVREGAADGVTLLPAAPADELPVFADELVPLLADRGLRPPAGAAAGFPSGAEPGARAMPASPTGFPSGAELGARPMPASPARTLRQRFGLARPANHFTEVRA